MFEAFDENAFNPNAFDMSIPEYTTSTSRGGASYRVVVDGEVKSTHNTERKASQAAVNWAFHLFDTDSKIKYEQVYEVDVTINAVDVTTRVGAGGVLEPMLENEVIGAGPGAYSLTGDNANLATIPILNEILAAEPAGYVLTGQSAVTGGAFVPDWSTTFDYSEACATSPNTEGLPDCSVIANDGTGWGAGGSGSVGGNFTKVTPSANNPNGAGGMGVRFYKGDGSNILSSEIDIQFGGSPRLEFWMRWYMRYEAGFAWAGGQPTYDKFMFVETAAYPSISGNNCIPGFGGGGFAQFAIRAGINGPGSSTQWTDVFGATSDGAFHLFEIHMKMDTDGTDGVGQMWIDQQLIVNSSTVNWSQGVQSMRDNGWTYVYFDSNQFNPSNSGGAVYVDWDDIAVHWSSTPTNTDSLSNPWIGPYGSSSSMSITQVFSDPVEDANFSSRGWVDDQGVTLSTDGALPSSTQSIDWSWTAGQLTPPGFGGAMRYNITPTDNVYLSYYMKLLPGWVGSQLTYHPHMLWFLTNKDGDVGPYGSELTVYSELNGTGGVYPRTAFANPANLDGVFYDSPDPLSLDTWYRVEVFFKLNTMTNDVGNSDGIFRCWINGALKIENTTVMMRTGAANNDMLFDQLGLGPYIQPVGGGGSPANQTALIDEIIIGVEA